MRFNFNMGNMADTSYIEKICEAHKECIGCPVMEKGAIQNTIDRVVYSCSTAIIKNIIKNSGKK